MSDGFFKNTNVLFLQEHEYALIDTNAYVMVIWNHEKHETHEMHEKWYTNGCTRMRGMCADFQEHELALIDTSIRLQGIEGIA